MKIVFHTNAPYVGSGYGVQAALFLPRFAALGHDIVVSSPFTHAGILEWQGFEILGVNRDPAGCDVILKNHEYYGADLTLTLCDPFGLLKCAEDLAQINVAHWFPVDTNPLGEGDVTVLREGGGTPIAISQFGAQVLRSEGADPLYVPHAVDTQVFAPGPQEPYRETVPGIGPDTFVIGICAMNRDATRKGLAEQLLAFSRFHMRHPDSFLALHTTPRQQQPGMDIPAMAARLQIAGAIGFPDGYMYDMGRITREMLAHWYRGLDVLSMCSYAEGFGLPLIEAQACGVPVITTDFASMTELCGAGWLVSGTPYWTTGHGAWWKRPDVDDIEAAYEAAWQAKQDGIMPKKNARDFALLYDTEKVTREYWVPVLEDLEDRLDSEKIFEPAVKAA